MDENTKDKLEAMTGRPIKGRRCGRCEEKIGRSPSVVAEFAPYAGMRLHVRCVRSLRDDEVPPEPIPEA